MTCTPNTQLRCERKARSSAGARLRGDRAALPAKPWERALFPLVLLATLVLWASAYTAIPIALESYAPQMLAPFRQFLSVLVTMPVLLMRPRGEVRSAFRRDWRSFLLMAFLGIGLYHIALSFGQRTVGPGMASLLINLSPLATALIGVAFLGERMGLRGWLGGAMACCGAAALIIMQNADFSVDPNAFLIVLATLSQSAYFVIQRKLTGRYSPVLLALVAIWLGAAMLAPFAGGLGAAIEGASISSTLAVVYLGALAGVWPYFGWAWVLSRMPAGKASIFIYTIPVISVALGWAVLGEAPTPVLLIAGAAILGGVGIASDSAPRAASRGTRGTVAEAGRA